MDVTEIQVAWQGRTHCAMAEASCQWTNRSEEMRGENVEKGRGKTKTMKKMHHDM